MQSLLLVYRTKCLSDAIGRWHSFIDQLSNEVAASAALNNGANQQRAAASAAGVPLSGGGVARASGGSPPRALREAAGVPISAGSAATPRLPPRRGPASIPAPSQDELQAALGVDNTPRFRSKQRLMDVFFDTHERVASFHMLKEHAVKVAQDFFSPPSVAFVARLIVRDRSQFLAPALLGPQPAAANGGHPTMYPTLRGGLKLPTSDWLLDQAGVHLPALRRTHTPSYRRGRSLPFETDAFPIIKKPKLWCGLTPCKTAPVPNPNAPAARPRAAANGGGADDLKDQLEVSTE